MDLRPRKKDAGGVRVVGVKLQGDVEVMPRSWLRAGWLLSWVRPNCQLPTPHLLTSRAGPLKSSSNTTWANAGDWMQRRARNAYANGLAIVPSVCLMLALLLPGGGFCWCQWFSGGSLRLKKKYRFEQNHHQAAFSFSRRRLQVYEILRLESKFDYARLSSPDSAKEGKGGLLTGVLSVL
jgi:hypothetical protein